MLLIRLVSIDRLKLLPLISSHPTSRPPDTSPAASDRIMFYFCDWSPGAAQIPGLLPAPQRFQRLATFTAMFSFYIKSSRVGHGDLGMSLPWALISLKLQSFSIWPDLLSVLLLLSVPFFWTISLWNPFFHHSRYSHCLLHLHINTLSRWSTSPCHHIPSMIRIFTKYVMRSVGCLQVLAAVNKIQNYHQQ